MVFFPTRNTKFLYGFLAKKQVSLSAVFLNSFQNFFLHAYDKPAFRGSIWLSNFHLGLCTPPPAGHCRDGPAGSPSFSGEDLNHLKKVQAPES